MKRRDSIKKFGSGIVMIFLGGCGGGSVRQQLPPTQPVDPPPIVPPDPPVPPSPTISCQLTLNQTTTRRITIEAGSSVLDAIKTAFDYYRTAPIEDTAAETTIEGISEHWCYQVGDLKPEDIHVHAQYFLIYTNSIIELIKLQLFP